MIRYIRAMESKPGEGFVVRMRRWAPWLALLALSLGLHLWGLGERAYHHDEAIHAHSAWPPDSVAHLLKPTNNTYILPVTTKSRTRKGWRISRQETTQPITPRTWMRRLPR